MNHEEKQVTTGSGMERVDDIGRAPSPDDIADAKAMDVDALKLAGTQRKLGLKAINGVYTDKAFRDGLYARHAAKLLGLLSSWCRLLSHQFLVRYLCCVDYRHQLRRPGVDHIRHHPDRIGLNLRWDLFVRIGQCIAKCWWSILLGK